MNIEKRAGEGVTPPGRRPDAGDDGDIRATRIRNRNQIALIFANISICLKSPCREMSSPEAEALVISNDPLHVRSQSNPIIFPHLSGEVACKFDTGVVPFVLPGNFLSTLIGSINLIHFIKLGWVTGTGGGICIRQRRVLL